MIAASCLACGGELSDEPTIVAGDRVHHLQGQWMIHSCSRCGSGTTLPLAGEDELGGFYAGG